MTAIEKLQRFLRRENKEQTLIIEPESQSRPASANVIDVEIAPNDPLLVYFQHSSGVVDVGKLLIESPATEALRAAGVKLVVPLVSQGELIGLINLGPRLSEQDYSTDDRHASSKPRPARENGWPRNCE
jgi:hypothetical protein